MGERYIIIGGGPAGLFAAWLLLDRGSEVTLYEKKSRPGLKFLLAGSTGLNITTSLPGDLIPPRYGAQASLFSSLLEEFSPTRTRSFFEALGTETFTGSGHRVFPREEDTGKLLARWLKRLEDTGRFSLKTEHTLTDWQGETLEITGPRGTVKETGAPVIFAMGGGSWPGTGSDGAWRLLFERRGLATIPLKPMNCGFLREWSPYLTERFLNQPLKNIALNYGEASQRGDLTLTSRGMEGSALYRFSRELARDLEEAAEATVLVDLTPDLSRDELCRRLSARSPKVSLPRFLAQKIKLDPLKRALLKELAADFSTPESLAASVKSLPLSFTGTDALERAISSRGGLSFEELDEYLMIKRCPGFFAAGEMLDWEAPTGGFLIQGCLATAYRAVKGAVRYHEENI